MRAVVAALAPIALPQHVGQDFMHGGVRVDALLLDLAYAFAERADLPVDPVDPDFLRVQAPARRSRAADRRPRSLR